MQHWFDDALGIDDPKPSRAACDRLAREFQITVNRHNNAELERRSPVDRRLLKDVSPAEELNKRVQEFTVVAKQLMIEANRIEDYAGEYQWGTVSLQDVQDILLRITTSPEASACLVTRTLAPVSRRRPHEAWHATGREMASLIKAVMRDAGYRRKKLRMTDHESVIAIVGAAAISWVYGIEIEAAGFASAMKERNRSKTKKSKALAERFLDPVRIKIMD